MTYYLSWKGMKFTILHIFYSCGANLKAVLENLKHDVSKLLYWFKINSMKSNPEKFNS